MNNYFELVKEGNFAAILAQLSDNAVIDTQVYGREEGKDNLPKILEKEKVFLDEMITKINVFHSFADAKHAVTEYELTLNNGTILPVAIVAVKEGDKFSAMRTYHSTYPYTESHVYRAPVLNTSIELTEPEYVVKYFQAIALGDVEETCATYAEGDVYQREPAGWEWTHRGIDALRKHYQEIFADGGVPLKFHNYVYDAEKFTFAGEYTCDEWGAAKFKPQAGMSIYEVAKETGKITACRIYDDVDPTIR